MASTEKTHSKLGASTAKRWLNCSGSVALIAKAPPASESSYAKEGTTAHELMEKLLKAGAGITKKEETKIVKDYPKAMFGAVEIFTDYVFGVMNDRPNAILLVEEKIDLSFIDPAMYGTVDVAIVEEFGTLEVCDYKHGQGIAVDADRNEQMLYYALGIAHKYDYNFDKVKLTIGQPRADHPDGSIRSWETDMDTLLTWRILLEKGVKRTKQKNATLFGGDWCRFCPASVICPEISTNTLKAAQIDFAPAEETIDLPAAKDLKPEVIAKVLEGADLLETWIKEVRNYATNLLERGGSVRGFKLVEKRANRKWKDGGPVDLAHEAKFQDLWEEPSLISPTQAEKKFGKDVYEKHLEKFVTQESSGTTIAPESDKRPAINQLQIDFEDKKQEVTNGKKESQKESNKKENSKKVSAKKENRGDSIDLGF